jgi:hypothetical protein
MFDVNYIDNACVLRDYMPAQGKLNLGNLSNWNLHLVKVYTG